MPRANQASMPDLTRQGQRWNGAIAPRSPWQACHGRHEKNLPNLQISVDFFPISVIVPMLGRDAMVCPKQLQDKGFAT